MPKPLSELQLVDYFKTILRPRLASVLKGVGDDAAVIKINSTTALVVTVDMLIEDKHFTRRDGFFDIGYKALACSLSDIAAMAALPKWAVVSLGLSKKVSMVEVKDLYRGLQKAGRQFGVDIVGGDVNAAEKIVIDVALIGTALPKKIVYRSGMQPGDYIFTSGKLGGSFYHGRHLRFTPRVREAQFLTRHYTVNAMMDISDGLTLDLWRMLTASRVGAVLFESLIPVHRDARSFDEALSMGEDFELLFSLPPSQGRRLLRQMSAGKSKYPFYFLGFALKEKPCVWMVDRKEKIRELSPKGFVHFSS